jgi:hypothetical protein
MNGVHGPTRAEFSTKRVGPQTLSDLRVHRTAELPE